MNYVKKKKNHALLLKTKKKKKQIGRTHSHTRKHRVVS